MTQQAAVWTVSDGRKQCSFEQVGQDEYIIQQKKSSLE